MSADGFGVLSVAALAIFATPLLIGGAMVAGGIYASGKLISHIAEEERNQRATQEKREAEKRARIAAEEADDRRKIQELMHSYSQLQNAQSSARQAMNRAYTESYATFVAKLQQSQEQLTRGTDILLNQAENDRNELISSWVAQVNQQADSFTNRVHCSLNEMREKASVAREKFQSLQTSTSEDIRICESAADQIESARILIKTLRVEFGSVPNSLINGYNTAVNYYNSKMYENAYSLASAVSMECYEALEKGLIELERKETLSNIIEMQLVELHSRLESMQKFEFDYKDERYEEDLLRFTPIANSLFAQLNEIHKQVSDTEKSDIRTLTELQHQLADIDLDITECTKLAVQRLLYAYTENDKATDITQTMEEQGYDVVGYAYESGLEGQPIHINFENRVTHGKVTVVLSPSLTDNEIHVDVHDYGADGMADVRRQDELRDLIAKTLAIPVSCSNRGHVSSNVSASDLESVERIHLQ